MSDRDQVTKLPAPHLGEPKRRLIVERRDEVMVTHFDVDDEDGSVYLWDGPYQAGYFAAGTVRAAYFADEPQAQAG